MYNDTKIFANLVPVMWNLVPNDAQELESKISRLKSNSGLNMHSSSNGLLYMRTLYIYIYIYIYILYIIYYIYII